MMKVNKLVFRTLAKLICLAIVVCSITSLPVISYAESLPLPTGYGDANYTHIYDGANSTYSVYKNNATEKYLLIISSDASLGYKANKDGLPQYDWCYLEDKTTRIDTDTEEIIFLSGITEIGSHIFRADGTITGSRYSILKKITLPDTLNKILAGAFAGTTTSSFEIIGGGSVTEAGETCFEGKKLANLNNFTALKALKQRAFSGITSSSVVIPPAVTGIDVATFGWGNSSITELDLRNCTGTVNFTYGNYSSFGEIKNLKTVYLPNSFTLPTTTLTHGNNISHGAKNVNFILPVGYSDMNTVREWFRETEHLIGSYDLTPIFVETPPTEGVYDITSGILTDGKYMLDDENKTLHIYGKGQIGVNQNRVDWEDHKATITKIVFHEGITGIQQQMFAGSLKWCMYGPDNTKNTDDDYSVYNLTAVELPITLSSIGQNGEGQTGGGTFSDNKNLSEVNLEDTSVSVINSSSFGGTALTEVSLPKTIKRIGNGAFYGTKLKNVTFDSKATGVNFGLYAFGGTGGALEYIQIPPLSTFNTTSRDPNGMFSSAKSGLVIDFMDDVPTIMKARNTVLITPAVTDPDTNEVTTPAVYADYNLFGTSDNVPVNNGAVAVLKSLDAVNNEEWTAMKALGFASKIISALPKNEDGLLSFAEDFEDADNISDITALDIYGGNASIVTDGGNKALKVTGGEQVILYAPASTTKSSIEISYKIKFLKAGSGNWNSFGATYGSDEVATCFRLGTQFFQYTNTAGTNNNQRLFYLTDADDSVLNDGKYHEIKYKIDFKNNKMRLTVDGNEKDWNLPVRTAGVNAVDRFFFDVPIGDEIYFDDLAISDDALKLDSALPVANSKNYRMNEKITLNLSSNILDEYLTKEYFEFYENDVAVPEYTVAQPSTGQITLTPANGFKGNSTYKVVIKNTVNSSSENSATTPTDIVYSFTTEGFLVTSAEDISYGGKVLTNGYKYQFKALYKNDTEITQHPIVIISEFKNDTLTHIEIKDGYTVLSGESADLSFDYTASGLDEATSFP